MVTKIFEANGGKNFLQSLSLKNFFLYSKQGGDSNMDNDNSQEVKLQPVKPKTKKKKSLVGKVNTTIVNKIKKISSEIENLEGSGFDEGAVSIKKKIVENIQTKLNKKVDKYNSNILDCEKSLSGYEENLSNLNSDEFKLKKVKDLKTFLGIKKNKALKILRERKIELDRALIDCANNNAQKKLIRAKFDFEKIENKKNAEFKIINKDSNGNEIIKYDYNFDIINGVVDIYDRHGNSKFLDKLIDCKCLKSSDLELINKIFKEYPSTILHIPYIYLKSLSQRNIEIQSFSGKFNLLEYIIQIANEGYEISASSGRSVQIKTRKDFNVMLTKDIKEFSAYMDRKVANKSKKYSTLKYRGVPDRNILKGGEFLFDGFGITRGQQAETQYIKSDFHNMLFFDRLHLFDKMKKYTFNKVAKRERNQELRKKEIKELISYVEKVKNQKEKDGVIGKMLKSVDIFSTNRKISLKNHLLQKQEKKNKSLAQKYYDKEIKSDGKQFEKLDKSKIINFCGYYFKVVDGIVDFRGTNAETILARLNNPQVYCYGDALREKDALQEIFLNYPKTLSVLSGGCIRKLQDININTYLNDKFIGTGLEYVRYLAEAGYDLRKKQGQKFEKFDLEDLEWLKNNSVVYDYEKFKLEQEDRKIKAEKRKEQRKKSLEMKKIKEEQAKKEQLQSQPIESDQQVVQNRSKDEQIVMPDSQNAKICPTSADYCLPMF